MLTFAQMLSENLLNFDELFLLQKQFFCTVNLKKFNWEGVLSNCDTEENQNLLLAATINHETNKNYPVKIDYQIVIIKHIINYLETKNIEVNSDFYEKLCELLTQPKTETAYLHFWKTPSTPLISVKESTSYISNGTTGLSLWPAARVLAEYFNKNFELLTNKTILELGCGIGFLGLSILKTSKPKKYLFSDCHSDVLNLVLSNIRLNLIDEKSAGILNLPWEDIDVLKLNDLSPDVILATDVVYDNSAVESLITVFKLCYSRGHPVRIYAACAVRNIETFRYFLDELDKLDGRLRYLDVETFNTYFPISDVPLKIFEVLF